MTRLDSYIFRQLAAALLAVTIGLAALVWLTQSLRFIELVLDRGLSFLVFIELTGLLLPSFFAVILPITTFVVILFVYVRLSADRELVVMRAAGLSQWRLARPAPRPRGDLGHPLLRAQPLARPGQPVRLPCLAVRDP
ncbi:LptF/LptG family permease [Dankookia sp. P2]|uniref:LptF/LptG family permease n=1 Tax=Dankookia sp. P2 TaxID=3423955 RepID=UPI003D66FC91